MMQALLDAARATTLLADGGMGTQLQRAGLEAGGCGDLWNLDHPERVLAIQRRYIAAGSQVLLTNTFGSNRYLLDRYDAGDRAAANNTAGAALARRAASTDVAGRAAGAGLWVLGDIGPFGGFVEPLGEHAADDVYRAFAEQARALLDGGVDGIIIETMTAIEEVVLAIRAARDMGAPFVIASMAFDATRAGLRTMMGTTPEQAAEAMLAAGADALGANCGTSLTLEHFAEIVRRYRAVASGAVVMIEPNAGQPELVGDQVVYRASPAEMAGAIGLLVDAGVNIIGGCCGTTPEHIRAFAHALAREHGREHGRP
jgi:5-methyltetrahydrofolate--homocysteine methyltransferase